MTAGNKMNEECVESIETGALPGVPEERVESRGASDSSAPASVPPYTSGLNRAIAAMEKSKGHLYYDNIVQLRQTHCTTDCQTNPIFIQQSTSPVDTFFPVYCNSIRCHTCIHRVFERRSKQLTRNILQHNLKYLLLLTYKPGSDTASIKHNLRSLLQKIKRLDKSTGTSDPLKYYWVVGTSSTGLPHFHVLINRALSKSWLSKSWKRLTKGSYVVDIQPINLGMKECLSKYVVANAISAKLAGGILDRSCGCSRGMKVNLEKGLKVRGGPEELATTEAQPVPTRNFPGEVTGPGVMGGEGDHPQPRTITSTALIEVPYEH